MFSIRYPVVAAAIVVAIAAPARADEGNWPSIRDALFPQRELKDGSSVIQLDAPYRAEDAAVVPISIKALIPQTPDRYIATVHLIIDQNPAPEAAVFHLHPEDGEATLSTRVRVNEYTPVHVVAETSDGQLYVVDRFVKAAGGCSAPALKDKETAMARLGQMRLKQETPFAPGQPNQLHLLISHPNYSGLQIDQVTRNWIPSDYVRSVKVTYAGRPVLEIDSDISISEDPSFTFDLVPQEPAELKVVVHDSSKRHFEKSFELGAGS
jgi:sulfur-oxidizing protein SoxY